MTFLINAMKKMLFWGGMLLLIFSLNACGTAGKIYEIIKDPSIDVGIGDRNRSANRKQSTDVSFSIVGEDLLNTNMYGESAPTAVEIYQLKDDARFLAADYDGLVYDIKGSLRKDYIDHEEFMIAPGGYRYVPAKAINKETRFIGIIAHYTDIDQTLWKKITPVKSSGERVHFLILLKEFEVKIDQTDE